MKAVLEFKSGVEIEGRVSIKEYSPSEEEEAKPDFLPTWWQWWFSCAFKGPMVDVKTYETKVSFKVQGCTWKSHEAAIKDFKRFGRIIGD